MSTRREFVAAIPAALGAAVLTKPVEKTAAKSTLYGGVHCPVPSCGYVMLNVSRNEHGFLTEMECTNRRCSGFGKRYRIPTVELEEIP